jgi:FMN phosphatase YigB (HAD superfamily)
MRAPFDHIRTWIFDLDNTLYPVETNLFALIDERMGALCQPAAGAVDRRGCAQGAKGLFPRMAPPCRG